MYRHVEGQLEVFLVHPGGPYWAKKDLGSWTIPKGEIEPGEVVSMEIVLPLAPYPLKVRAIVRYRMGLRHGFEFLAMTSDQHGTIQRTCEMLSAGT